MNSGSNPMIPVCNKSILKLTQTVPVFNFTTLAVQQIFCSSVVCVVVFISDVMFKDADEFLSDGLLEGCLSVLYVGSSSPVKWFNLCVLSDFWETSQSLFVLWWVCMVCSADESPGRCCFSSPLLLWHFELLLSLHCLLHTSKRWCFDLCLSYL